jgi:hypothetical protein
MAVEKGPPCEKCKGETYISEWGSRPVNRITYCKKCNKIAGAYCTCPPRSGSFR